MPHLRSLDAPMPVYQSYTPTSLVPQVVDSVSAPVIAAALALGAEGVRIGTAFLACEEFGASTPHREALLGGQAGKTALTRGFTGRLARGIQNHLMNVMNAPDMAILPYPLQRLLMKNISGPAEKAGRS